MRFNVASKKPWKSLLCFTGNRRLWKRWTTASRWPTWSRWWPRSSSARTGSATSGCSKRPCWTWPCGAAFSSRTVPPYIKLVFCLLAPECERLGVLAQVFSQLDNWAQDMRALQNSVQPGQAEHILPVHVENTGQVQSAMAEIMHNAQDLVQVGFSSFFRVDCWFLGMIVVVAAGQPFQLWYYLQVDFLGFLFTLFAFPQA